jgi:plastocyanin domain-containing protein
MDRVLITILGILAIGFTYWFFLMKRERVVKAMGASVDVIVEGGYSPEAIIIPYGKPIKLNFLRKDPSSCLEEVVLGDFKIRKALPLNEKVAIELTPDRKGEFVYSCGMNMYHGKIIVK